MLKLHNSGKLTLLAFLLSASLTAGDRFVVKVDGDIASLAQRYNLRVLKSLTGSGSGVHVVSAPDGADGSLVLRNLKLDAQVRGAEPEKPLLLPGLSSKKSTNPTGSRLAPS